VFFLRFKLSLGYCNTAVFGQTFALSKNNEIGASYIDNDLCALTTSNMILFAAFGNLQVYAGLAGFVVSTFMLHTVFMEPV